MSEGTRVAIGLGLALGLLVLVGLAAFGTTTTALDDARAARGSHGRLVGIEQVFSAIQDVHRAARGYALSGADRDLDSYRAARGRLDERLPALVRLVADAPAQQQSLRTLRGLVAQLLDHLARLVDTRRQEGLAAASRLAAEGRGQALVEEIRGVVGRMQETEAAGLERDSRGLERAYRATRLLIASAVALSLLLSGLAWMVSRRFRVERRGSQTALESANQLLSHSLARLERHSQDVAALGQLGELLLSCDSVEESYGVVGHFGQELLPGVSGMLALLGETRDAVGVVARWGPAAAGADGFAPQDCWALRRGGEHLTDPSTPEPPCGHLPKAGVRFALCVPMSAHGEAFGVMTFLDMAREGGAETPTLSDEQRTLAVALAERVALSLSNLRLREELRAHSIRDALTGLFNRRFMEESLAREVARAGRGAGPLAVVMIDLDHFKRFNDVHGHEAGDEVLRAFGEFLRGRTRGSDVACRYGGEEFALILPGATLDDATARAEEIRRQAKLLHVRLGERSLGPVTLSLGVAGLPDHGFSPGDLLRAADHALYEAKRAGRDRVVVAEAPPV